MRFSRVVERGDCVDGWGWGLMIGWEEGGDSDGDG